MENITDVQAVQMENSNFVKPFRILYKQNGREKIWDLVKVHESVSIIIFNVETKKLVLVKQFRPAVYYSSLPAEGRTNPVDTGRYPAELGITLELCAGIVDKNKSLAEIAAEEVFEECGYKVNPNTLEYVTQFRSGVGISGDLQTLFYVEVTSEMQVTSGGGNVDEGELIEVVEMSIKEAEDYLGRRSVTSPGGFLFGLQWFLHKKAPLFA